MSKAIEPTVNLRLAAALRGQHPNWKKQGTLTAERQRASDKGSIRPDLLLHPSSLVAPISIETEFSPAPNVEREAQARLGLRLKGIAQPIEQCFAVKLDTALAVNEQDDEWEEALTHAEYQFCLYQHDKASTPTRWPKQGWIAGSLSTLTQSLECALISPSLLTRGMDYLQEGVQTATAVLIDAGMPHVLKHLGASLKQKPGVQTTCMAMAILANALNFHQSIAETHEVKTLAQMRAAKSDHWCQSIVLAEWERILREINYWPIFRIAADLLYPIPRAFANRVLTILAETAHRLTGIGATTLHDMAGRMLQQLIADRKLLATFYTLPLSAALLAELAVSRLPLDWADADTYQCLRVGDLACGTGTLISAAYQALLSRYRRAGGDDRNLHRRMIEHALYALDVMPVATHLTASQLASAHPGDTFKQTQIHTMEYGTNADTQKPVIGSLELLSGRPQPSLFHTHEQVIGDAATQSRGESWVSLAPGTLDLAIMNPPFTRPTNHENTDKVVPSFAGFDTPGAEQKMMSQRLNVLRRKLSRPVGNGNAGLASNFIDLADFMLKKSGGILALVLPFTFVQGAGWRAARELLVHQYTDIMLLSIATPQRIDRSWSADTHMAEVMVLATRKAVTPRTAWD